MRVLSLFSGGGLGDYGLTLAGMEIVGQVEIDKYCQKVLELRWPNVPKWKDIREVKGKEILERCGGAIDLVSGGFPCQPFSTAGKQKGESDERNLWPEMHRIIREIKPRWVLAENVPGIMSKITGWYIRTVFRDLAQSGYRVEWDCIPASAVGANHIRDRVWILAHTKGQPERTGLCQDESRGKRRGRPSHGGSTSAMAYTKRGVLEESRDSTANENRIAAGSWWAVEPGMGRMAYGIASRVDRLKLLGNGQVVQVVEWIGKQIMEFEKCRKA